MSQRCRVIARLVACESVRGADVDRRVNSLIQFAVEGALSGAYSHLAIPYPSGTHLRRFAS